MNGESHDCTKNVCSRNYRFYWNAEKKTNVKVTFEGELATAVPTSVTKLGNVLFGDWKDIEPLLANLTENKDYVVVEQDGRNSSCPITG